MTDFEFYETPDTYTRYLFSEVEINGTVFEPCVGSGAILGAVRKFQWFPAGTPDIPSRRLRRSPREWPSHWVTNDLDPRWSSDFNADAADVAVWQDADRLAGGIDWTVTNPPFTPAIEIIRHALKYSRVGVAMHLRASIHEVLKTGIRRTFLSEHTPTGILWLPRFAYQRSKKTGDWTTDSVCACWVAWLKDPSARQFIRYAPEWVLDQLAAETPAYRARMDALMKERRVERAVAGAMETFQLKRSVP